MWYLWHGCQDCNGSITTYNYIAAHLATKQELIEVIQLVEQGDLQPIVAKTLPLEEVNAGLEEVKKGGNTGRIVLTVE